MEWTTWSKEELEKQMSPSRWNPIKSADEVISQHISVCMAETNEAKQRIPCKLNISYGESAMQKYDMYGMDLPNNAIIVFWIHGGYWQEGSKDISAVAAQNLYTNGFKLISLGYTLAPQATIREMQKEVFSALQKAMLENKEACFVLAGHSAGAQLAAMTLLHGTPSCHEFVDMDRVSGFLLFAGVYDLRPLVPTYVNEPLKLTSGEAETLSPLLQPFRTSIKQDVPILICVGEFDPPEFCRQSTLYLEKLQTAHMNARFWTSDTDDHFTLVERLFDCKSSSTLYILNFLENVKLIK